MALLSGQGGAGKSRLALQLALALVEGRKDWLPGGPDLVDSGPAVVATWEDEPDEIARRLRGMVETPDRLAALERQAARPGLCGQGRILATTGGRRFPAYIHLGRTDPGG